MPYAHCLAENCGKPLPAAFWTLPSWSCYCSTACAKWAGNTGRRLAEIETVLSGIAAAETRQAEPVAMPKPQPPPPEPRQRTIEEMAALVRETPIKTYLKHATKPPKR